MPRILPQTHEFIEAMTAQRAGDLAWKLQRLGFDGCSEIEYLVSDGHTDPAPAILSGKDAKGQVLDRETGIRLIGGLHPTGSRRIVCLIQCHDVASTASSHPIDSRSSQGSSTLHEP